MVLHKFISFHGDNCCITPPLRITPSSLQVSTRTECFRAPFQQQRLQYHLYQQESKGVFISVEYNKYYSLKLLNATSALPHILSTKAEFSMTRFFFFFLVHQTEFSQKPIRNLETNSQQKLSYSQKPLLPSVSNTRNIPTFRHHLALTDGSTYLQKS